MTQNYSPVVDEKVRNRKKTERVREREATIDFLSFSVHFFNPNINHIKINLFLSKLAK